MKNVVTDPEKIIRILKTATETFGQQSFIKSKTDQTANQAQVPKGLPFHYLGGKRVLYFNVLKYAYYRIYDHMDLKKRRNTPGLTAMTTTVVRYELKL